MPPSPRIDRGTSSREAVCATLFAVWCAILALLVLAVPVNTASAAPDDATPVNAALVNSALVDAAPDVTGRAAEPIAPPPSPGPGSAAPPSPSGAAGSPSGAPSGVPSQVPPGSSPATPSPTPPGPGVTPGLPPSSGPPAPSPSQAPSGVPGVPGRPEGGDGCSWFDVGCKAKEAIVGFFRGIVTAALNPVFRLLGESVLSSPRVDRMDRVRGLWTTSAQIADGCLVLLVVVGGIVLMGHGSVQVSYTAREVAPRLVVAVVAANMSLLIVGQAIGFANGLSRALMGQGVDPDQASATLMSLVSRAVTSPGDPFLPLVGVVAVVLGVLVAVVFVVRTMLLVLLTAAAPLALACHALPYTEGLARLWWRALAGVLAIQIAQSLVLITALRVFFSSDQIAVFGIPAPSGLFDLLLVICLLYVLVRIPSWISKLIWQSAGRSPVKRAVRSIAAIVIFRRILGH